MVNSIVGGEDGRFAGWPSTDPIRRRSSGPNANDAILSRQKAPVPSDSNISKDGMVCILFNYILDYGSFFIFLEICKVAIPFFID